jgi:methylase of polypeptide subunit release factors
MSTDQSDWKNSGINVESLWLIDSRDKSGKHANVYHGNFIPQIPHQLICRYTKENNTVLDLFMGSGTTLFECETLHRNFIGFDINQNIIDYVESKISDDSDIKFSINNCDVTDPAKFDLHMQQSLQKINATQVDFIIAHPPYLDIVKFTNDPRDLSQISDVVMFVEKFILLLHNAWRYLAPRKYFALVIGDVYKNSEVIPLGFKLMDAIKQNFNVKLKGIVVKNIAGNRGKLGVQDIWHYRALKSDYYIFKHEYIFIFKKES